MSDDLDFMPADPREDQDAGDEPGSKSKSGGEDREEGERVELPTWNRARRKRKANVKAAEQDDAFQRGVRKAGRQVIDTPKLVIGAIVIVIGAIAGGVALQTSRTQTNAEAARILAGATESIYRAQVIPMEEREGREEQIAAAPFPVYASAEERDAAVVEAIAAAKGEHDAVALDAILVEGAYAVRKGEFEAAVASYDAFLVEARDDHPLRFLALEGKGVALEGQGELEAALTTFESIAPDPADYYREMALYHQGRVLEALEREDEAIAIYQQFFSEFPDKETMATPMVRARIEELDPEFAARLSAPPSGLEGLMGGL